MANEQCPLCDSAETLPFSKDRRRDYWRCDMCQLVFVAAAQHLSIADEKAVYDLHQNAPTDQGYRRFLSRLCDPLVARLASGASGLDYGSGPGPTLSVMLQEQGFDVVLFDPIYTREPEVLRRSYDFVTCTEVVEHFCQPRQEFEALFKMLRPGGVLGIMTKRVIDAQAFANWHYKNDMTHVSFFSQATFVWLAAKYHCEVEFLHQDVAILQRRALV